MIKKHLVMQEKGVDLVMRVEIPLKLPSLNDYTKMCRADGRYANKVKQNLEQQIGFFLIQLPRFERPVKIHFTWVESNKRRDLDNICFAKKFILDAMVKYGKLKDDNRKCVTGFTDEFEYSDKNKVVLEIEEL